MVFSMNVSECGGMGRIKETEDCVCVCVCVCGLNL